MYFISMQFMSVNNRITPLAIYCWSGNHSSFFLQWRLELGKPSFPLLDSKGNVTALSVVAKEFIQEFYSIFRSIQGRHDAGFSELMFSGPYRSYLADWDEACDGLFPHSIS